MDNPGPPITPDTYRAVVLESNGNTTYHDYLSLEAAIGHANDAASESDDAPPIAYVLDSESNIVHKGRHYAA